MRYSLKDFENQNVSVTGRYMRKNTHDEQYTRILITNVSVTNNEHQSVDDIHHLWISVRNNDLEGKEYFTDDKLIFDGVVKPYLHKDNSYDYHVVNVKNIHYVKPMYDHLADAIIQNNELNNIRTLSHKLNVKEDKLKAAVNAAFIQKYDTLTDNTKTILAKLTNYLNMNEAKMINWSVEKLYFKDETFNDLIISPLKKFDILKGISVQDIIANGSQKAEYQIDMTYFMRSFQLTNEQRKLCEYVQTLRKDSKILVTEDDFVIMPIMQLKAITLLNHFNENTGTPINATGASATTYIKQMSPYDDIELDSTPSVIASPTKQKQSQSVQETQSVQEIVDMITNIDVNVMLTQQDLNAVTTALTSLKYRIQEQFNDINKRKFLISAINETTDIQTLNELIKIIEKANK